MNEKNINAIIFDMDGVLVNNNPHHLVAWRIFCEKYNFNIIEDFNSLYGTSNKSILQAVFQRNLNPDEIKKYGFEKEAMYREIYKAHICEVEGLTTFLKHLKANGYKTAVATSAPTENLNFVLDSLNIRKYFDVLVDETFVSEAKPSPEIYLLTAQKLNVQPLQCIVFEDSFSGIKSATDAGMKVIGITTTHDAIQMQNTIACVPNFASINLIDITRSIL